MKPIYKHEILFGAISRNGNKIKKKDVLAVLFNYNGQVSLTKRTFSTSGMVKDGWCIEMLSKNPSMEVARIMATDLYTKLNLPIISYHNGSTMESLRQ